MLKEEILVMPDVIGPDPGASAVLLAFCGEEVKVVPPELFSANGDHFVCCLVTGHLLVKSEMEERGIAERLTNLFDEIGANLIVDLGGDHSAVFLEPGVVTAGEIELRNGSDAESASLVQLRFEEVLVPSVGCGDLGVRLVLYAVANVNEKHIEFMIAEVFDGFVPDLNVNVVGFSVILREIPASGGSGFIVPHVSTELYHEAPIKILVHFDFSFLPGVVFSKLLTV
jgi:hypothetical protein